MTYKKAGANQTDVETAAELNANGQPVEGSNHAEHEPLPESKPGNGGGESPSALSRRRFLAGLAATTGVLAFGAHPVLAKPRSTLPHPARSGIEHVVVVMMENRSFDHLFGWLPGADGQQAGLTYVDRDGVAQATYPLAPDYQGCGHPDPDHSYQGGRIEFDGGACDGWLQAGDNDLYAIGYYTPADLPFYGQAVPLWTTFSRYFAAIMAETFPNRVYQHAAQTDRIDNSTDISTLPTIWDRLAEEDLEGRYYFSDVPFLALWGSKYLSIGRSFVQFLADCAAGDLPPVAFVDPRFLGEAEGISGDDHPHADIRNGQAFVDLVYRAVTSSPAWAETLLIFNYDEWGGFFEHVPPPTAPIPKADQAAGNADGRLGFRVPCLLVAPWARRGYISDTFFYDHTSILKLIEWRWGLGPLTVRDKSANNLAEALDFTRPNLAAPQFSVPPGPFGSVCPSGLATPASEDHWLALKAMAQSFGWPV